MEIKEQTNYSMFFRKEYTEKFEETYQEMEKDIKDGKFNLSMEDYVQVYEKFLNLSVCDELVENIKKHPNLMSFSGALSDPLRTGKFVNIYGSKNNFVKNTEKLIEESIEKLTQKYVQDVRPLYYSYGDKFNHYTYHILKYNQEDYFRMHHDHYAETLNYSRLLTACIYLNEDYSGGELEFPSIGKDKKYKFSKGDAIIFPSHWMFYHGVSPITSGERFNLIMWIGLDLSDTATKYFTF